MKLSVSKEQLQQYYYLREEIEKTKESIRRTEDDLVKINTEGTVVDKVTGGYGGIQGFRIEGFPIAEYERKRKLLNSRRDKLVKKENDLIELEENILTEINGIENSRDRLVLTMVFIENKTQNEIARELHFDRSLVSKIISKYL